MEWISVKDRLPDHPRDYLVIDRDLKIGIGNFDINKGEFNICNHCCDVDYEYITHWMYLPGRSSDNATQCAPPK
jgi:hypothetical protein